MDGQKETALFQVVREYRTAQGKLLFKLVQYRGHRHVSIKCRGSGEQYLVPLENILHDGDSGVLTLDAETK